MEIRVPDLGMAFTALASSIRADGVFLTTLLELPIGTTVTVALSLRDGPAIVDGVVVDQAGLGIAIDFKDADAATRARLSAVDTSRGSITGPATRVA